MQCPKCANDLIENMRYCPYCGLDFDAKPNKAAARPVSAQSGLKEYWPDPAESPAKNNNQPDNDFKQPGFTLFSAKGRLSRLKYFYFLVCFSIAARLMITGVDHVPIQPGTAWLFLLYFPIALTLITVEIITVIKRFHDIGKPGYHVLLLLIPLYNIYVGLKLLFKDSVYGRGNTYGPYERNSWYWQVPLTLLLLPVIYFGLTAGGIAQKLAAQNAEPLHYYNQSQQISMTFPEGWKEVRMEGYLTAARDFSGSSMIALETMATSDPSFSEYTDEELQLMISNVGDTELLADMLGYQYWNVAGLNSSKRIINGMVFLVADFTQKQDRVLYRQVYLFGCEDGKYITLQLVLSNPDEEGMAELLASADTLRIGDSATAEPARWD